MSQREILELIKDNPGITVTDIKYMGKYDSRTMQTLYAHKLVRKEIIRFRYEDLGKKPGNNNKTFLSSKLFISDEGQRMLDSGENKIVLEIK